MYTCRGFFLHCILSFKKGLIVFQNNSLLFFIRKGYIKEDDLELGHFLHLAAPRNWKASRNLSCMKIPIFSKNFGLSWVGLGFLRWRFFLGEVEKLWLVGLLGFFSQ